VCQLNKRLLKGSITGLIQREMDHCTHLFVNMSCRVYEGLGRELIVCVRNVRIFEGIALLNVNAVLVNFVAANSRVHIYREL